MVIMQYCMRFPGNKGFHHDPRVLEQCIVVIKEVNRTKWYGVGGPVHARGNSENLEASNFQWHKSKE